MTVDTDLPLPKVMDLLLDTVCVVDAEGRFVFVSASCERLLGYSPDELIGRNMIELVYPEDRERTLQTASAVMRGRPQVHFENRYVRKDGRVVHIMWSARWSASDRLRLAVARDITELKRATLQQNAIYRISEAAHAADGLLALYGHIHAIIGELMPADNFSVALYDSANETLSFPYFINEQGGARRRQPLVPGTPLAQVINGGRPLLTTRGSVAQGGNAADAGLSDRANWLGVPLAMHDGLKGALVVQTFAPGVTYTVEDRDLLQFVSTQVASAIERKQAEARLHHMARHDALTDLPNRALFHDRFDMALIRARREDEYVALLFIDLNGFKRVNDDFGHAVGDRLLRRVAQRLSEAVRESDTVARMGGDEFTVLLTNISGPDCVDLLVEKIRAAINAPLEVDGRTLAVSACIGVALYPHDGRDRQALMRYADTAMYAAKRGLRD